MGIVAATTVDLSRLFSRSALKKILERDDVSSRTMVLCVTSVSVTANQTEGVSQDQKDKDGGKDVQGSSNKTEVGVFSVFIYMLQFIFHFS